MKLLIIGRDGQVSTESARQAGAHDVTQLGMDVVDLTKPETGAAAIRPRTHPSPVASSHLLRATSRPRASTETTPKGSRGTTRPRALSRIDEKTTIPTTEE